MTYACDHVRKKFSLTATCCKDCHAQGGYHDYALPGFAVFQVCCAVQMDLDQHADDIKHKLSTM